MDDKGYASSYLDVLTMNCMKETKENPTTYKQLSQPSNEEDEHGEDLVQIERQIAEMQCLSSCSKTGTCVESNCVCTQGNGCISNPFNIYA